MAMFDHVKMWIFDLDETLYPEQRRVGPVEGQAEKSIKIHAEHAGMSVEELSAMVEELRKTHADPIAAIRKQIPFPFDTWYQMLKIEGLYDSIERCEKVPDLLPRIKTPMMIFTNGGDGHAKYVMERCNIDPTWFKHVITNETHDVLPKPHLDAYKPVLELVGVPAQHCAFVEDKAINLEPAKKLGMTTVHVHKTPTNAPYVDHYYSAISDLLQQLVQE